MIGRIVRALVVYGKGAVLRFYDDAETGFAGCKSPTAFTGNVDYTMPAAPPVSNGQVAASTTAGVMSWTNPGEANTASNVGTGNGVFKAKVAVDLQFKSLIAGSNITIVNNANDLTISGPSPGEANTASNVGSGTGVFKSKSGVDLQFKSLSAGANVTITSDPNNITVAAANPGETNTASNVGAGSGIFKAKAGVDLQFKSLIAGSNITLTPGTNDLTIAASGGTGEANTASNVGAGDGLFKTKSGVDLQFKTLIAGTNITLTPGTDDVTIEATSGATLTDERFASGTGTTTDGTTLVSLFSADLGGNACYEVTAIGFYSSGGGVYKGYGSKTRGILRQNGGGTASICWPELTPWTEDRDGLSPVGIIVSNVAGTPNWIEVFAIGAAGKTINWKASIRYTQL